MNISEKQNRLFLLVTALLVLAIVLCGTFNLLRKRNASVQEQSPAGVTTEEVVLQETSSSLDGVSTAATADKTVKTVVYLKDNYGYLVPVTKSVPEAQGIAKATLSLMVSSAYNDMEAARLGLRTLMPEGTTIELDISESGVARIDLSGQVLKLQDADAETAMVSGVVQALTEFPTVKTVRFLVDHKQRATLTHGTDISGDFTRGSLNLESASIGLEPGDSKTVQLYFPGESSSLIVPVTRMVYGINDLETAVLELTKGPSDQSPLDPTLPAGCGLISVGVKDGVATINFTREFINIAEESDGGRAALKALVLTCTRFKDVNTVQIQVEGEPYDPGQSTLAVPTFINDAGTLAEEYIRLQTAEIIDE